jgi:hypothetical protein
MVYYLAWKQVGFIFSRFAHQQAVFVRQRKTGAFVGLSVNLKQLFSCASGCHNAGIDQFKSD